MSFNNTSLKGSINTSHNATSSNPGFKQSHSSLVSRKLQKYSGNSNFSIHQKNKNYKS